MLAKSQSPARDGARQGISAELNCPASTEITLQTQLDTTITAPTAILKLYIGNSFTGVTVEPDAGYPSMWRIHMGQLKSGMVNLTRAKDAAIVWACPKGLGGNEVAHWHRRETPARPAYRRFSGRPATHPHPRGREPKNPDTVRNSKRSTSHERSGVRS